MSQAIEQEIRTLRAHFWSARDPEGRAFAPLADAYRRKGDLEEARSLVEDGLARLPDFTPGYLVAARVHRKRGDMLEARSALDALLTLDRENVLALLDRAELSRDAGDRVRAAADLTTLLELAPGHLGARSALEAIEREAAAPLDPLPSLEEESLEDPTRDPVSGLETTEEFSSDRVLDSVDGIEFDASADLDPPGSEPGSEGPLDLPGIEIDTDLGLEPSPDDPEPDMAEVGAGSADPEPGAGPAPEPESEVSSGIPFAHFEQAAEAAEELPAHVTRTMAEIFVRQGLHDRAIEVYQQLLERAPHDDELRDRLGELRGDPASFSGDVAPDDSSYREELDTDTIAPHREELDTDTTAPHREKLEAIAPHWADDDDDSGSFEEASAFGWREDAPDDGVPGEEEFPDSGDLSAEPAEQIGDSVGVEKEEDSSLSAPSIRAHFQDLLAWVPGAVSVEALSPVADPALAPEGSPLALALANEAASPLPSFEAPSAERQSSGGDVPEIGPVGMESDGLASSLPDSADEPDAEDDLDDFRNWLESLEP